MTTFVRTLLGDLATVADGFVYAHEHLILDSPLIADRFPEILLDDVAAAVAEVDACKRAGVALMVDAMPMSAGRDVVRLAEIARRTDVDIVSATGLHHDRYYGDRHWTNRVSSDELAELFIADLSEGIDAFDGTGPLTKRTAHRAGVIKVATSGERLNARDKRNLDAAAAAALATGAPVLTHCEGGRGALAQVEHLSDSGIAAHRILLSHVDKTHDLGYLRAVADTGAVLELDQSLRLVDEGNQSFTVRALFDLASSGHTHQLVVGTDGAKRGLWSSLGGTPGLAWLARTMPSMLAEAGLEPAAVTQIMRENAIRALNWVAPSS